MKGKIIPAISTTLVVVVLLLPGCSGETPTTPDTFPPLILLFSIDTLRADHLSCYGYHRPTTPFIDRFAERAVLFENAISQGAVTAPGHMSIFTSLMPVVHRVSNPHTFHESIFPLAETIPTWTELLQEHDWITHGLHGGGPVSAQFGFDRGFDSYRDDFFYAFHIDYYRPEREIAAIRDIIRSSRQEERPLFLFLHHYLCHDPYLKAPPDYNQAFLENPVPGLPLTRDDLKRREGGAIDEESFWDDFDLENQAHLDHLIALYDGNILYSDHIFQQVIDVLREEEVFEDSLIILTSDHGEEFYEHGGYRHWRLFVENLHVPLIIQFPDQEFAGKRVSRYVRTLDLLPTIFEYLEIPIQHLIQGESFLTLLTGRGTYDPLIMSEALDFYLPDEPEPRESIRIMADGYSFSNQLSNGNWRPGLEGQEEWLFNLDDDPREQVNLIDKEPEIAALMRTRAEEILEEHRILREYLELDPGEASAPGEDLRRQLQSLGYLQ